MTAAASTGTSGYSLLLADDAVQVTVADTGPGVPADQVGAIFERGWSSKASTAEGRGVGLALVQVVCERRGGAVTVRPGGAGSGAVFEARLPRVQAVMQEVER